MLPVSESYGTYDVTPDGQKFLVGVGESGGSRTITVMSNWVAELRARAPAK